MFCCPLCWSYLFWITQRSLQSFPELLLCTCANFSLSSWNSFNGSHKAEISSRWPGFYILRKLGLFSKTLSEKAWAFFSKTLSDKEIHLHLPISFYYDNRSIIKFWGISLNPLWVTNIRHVNTSLPRKEQENKGGWQCNI